MMFSPPKTDYSNFYDVERFNLTWKVCLFLVIFMPILGITLSSLGEISILPTLSASVCAILLLVILKIQKSFYLTSILFSIIGTVLIQLTFILYVESHHIVDTMWMIVIILFAFFTLGKVWGMVVSFFNVIGIIYFLFFVLRENLLAVKDLNYGDILALSVNFIIAFSLISYLINQFLISSKYSEEKYIKLTEKLEETNKDKTIMLKEIHHRVKNNLQVITSLLRLQSREIKDVASKTIYEESINRVIAMALIHEKMYQTENLAKINLEEYINTLSQDLLNSYSVKQKVVIKVSSDIESINTKHIVPLALIFNELISNSIKHAFTNIKKNGEINISIVNNKSHISLEYFDNGQWKQSDNTESFGIELIDSLTEQLSGSYNRQVDNGTTYLFTFAPIK